MASWMTKGKIRRRQVRQRRAEATGSWWRRVGGRAVSWPVMSSLLFVIVASCIALSGEVTLGFSIGQRIEHPITAQVDFQIPNEDQTKADRQAARAATPSYYVRTASSLTFDRIRAELVRLHQAAIEAETFEDYQLAIKDQGWPAQPNAYHTLHGMADEAGRTQFRLWVDRLPLEGQYIAGNLNKEDRTPKSAADFIRIVVDLPQSGGEVIEVKHRELVPQGAEKAVEGVATAIARKFGAYELVDTVEAIVFATLREQPTLVFDQERTAEAMRLAAEATPVATTIYERGTPFVTPGDLGPEELNLLRAHHAAYMNFIRLDSPGALAERQNRMLRRAGMVILVTLLSIGLLGYTRLSHPRVFEIGSRTVAFMVLVLGTLVAARLLSVNWPQIPELMYVPCLAAGSVLAIVYPRRFAMGAVCLTSVMVGTIIQEDALFLLTLLTGAVVAVFQLDEIRSRTKLITSGMVTALAVMLASTGAGLLAGNSLNFVAERTLWAGACVLCASFIVSGVLPVIERLFRIATSLTLLEWRDPTRPLLQRLARDAPGTYNHSLTLGTLADAACERIGANALLAQVGALYHDIGKLHKADYFAENQEGQINRHDNLAPTMSLLIILGHVKDGVEMAREYKLPTALHQFVAEHHGTTVVRYFHHVASEKQPLIASGKHDRKVPEAEFRYAGPKPRTKESAVLMLCDGVEGAVRALPEPTPGRIEGVVHQIVTDRLNDGQFDDCDITLKDIHLVEETLAKSLCGIYHGRVAYPKARKTEEVEEASPQRASG